MATSFQRTYASRGLLLLVPLIPRQATIDTCRDSKTLTGKSDSVSCGVTAPFPWVLVCTRFVCALQESLFPWSCGNSVIKSQWPSKSDSLGIPSPFARMNSRWIFFRKKISSLFYNLWLIFQQNENALNSSVAPQCPHYAYACMHAHSVVANCACPQVL